MKHYLHAGILGTLVLAMVFVNAPAASAQTSTEELRALIDQLTAQVQALQEQITALSTRTDAMLALTQDLGLGAEGSEVELLQRILASDPELYPEGLVTGFFGPLTQAAVKRFEARYELDGDGELDVRARAVVNSMLEEGNAAGIVPPGLLTAPGIRDRRVEIRIRTDEDGRVRYEVKTRGDDDDDEEDDDSDDDDDEDSDEDEEDDSDDEDEEDNSGSDDN